jgi:hypothetical protein
VLLPLPPFMVATVMIVPVTHDLPLKPGVVIRPNQHVI